MGAMKIAVQTECPECRYLSRISPKVFAERSFVCPMCGMEKEIRHDCERVKKLMDALYSSSHLISQADIRIKL